MTERANWTWMDSASGVPNGDAIYDRVGHGTHVAGIAAAAGNRINACRAMAGGGC